MEGTIVGVLRGGPSREHEVSLATGRAVAAGLPPERFSVRDIYIDKQGFWHERGRPTAPERVLPAIDVALVALHGEYGEDGEVQKVLERFGTPYAGSGPMGSFLAMHKALAKERAKEIGLLTPRYRLVETPAYLPRVAREITRDFLQPVVVKPVRWGSSVGVSIVGGYGQIYPALRTLFDHGAGNILVEEYVRGREATVGVVENLRGEELYALPPVEIVPPTGDFFSYAAKYSGKSEEIVPARFPYKVKQALIDAAKKIHGALGLRHYSRSDFIVTPSGQVQYLETNALPGLTPESLLPKALAAVGISLHDFLLHLVHLARTR